MTHLVHLMFDLETLGLREDTVVLSCACVPFTLEDHDYFQSFYNQGLMIKFNVAEQMEVYHRSVSKSTIEWWKEQSKEAKRANLNPSPNDFSLVDGLKVLSKFIQQTGYDYKKSYVWSRGSSFDFPKLEHLYEVNAKLPTPFNTWKIRDTRTYIDILNGVDNAHYDLKWGLPIDFVAHNPLYDAALEAAKLNEIYYKLNEEDIPF